MVLGLECIHRVLGACGRLLSTQEVSLFSWVLKQPPACTTSSEANLFLESCTRKIISKFESSWRGSFIFRIFSSYFVNVSVQKISQKQKKKWIRKWNYTWHFDISVHPWGTWCMLFDQSQRALYLGYVIRQFRFDQEMSSSDQICLLFYALIRAGWNQAW